MSGYYGPLRTLASILADLRDAFPHSKAPDETLRLYAGRLDDIPVEVLDRAASILMDTVEHFPTMKAIRETAAELILALPDDDLALAQIEDRIAWARLDEDERGTPPELDETVKRALSHVGGFHAFKAADEPAVIRGQFLRLYRELRVAKVRELQVRQHQRPALNRPPMRAVS